MPRPSPAAIAVGYARHAWINFRYSREGAALNCSSEETVDIDGKTSEPSNNRRTVGNIVPVHFPIGERQHFGQNSPGEENDYEGANQSWDSVITLKRLHRFILPLTWCLMETSTSTYTTRLIRPIGLS
jgi:hypothetical protein